MVVASWNMMFSPPRLEGLAVSEMYMGATCMGGEEGLYSLTCSLTAVACTKIMVNRQQRQKQYRARHPQSAHLVGKANAHAQKDAAHNQHTHVDGTSLHQLH